MSFNTVAKYKSWSWTRWSDWDRCPAFAKYKHIDKLPEPKSSAMLRGAAVAEAGEKFLKKEVAKLAPELKPVAKEFGRLRNIRGLIVESQWGFTAEWEPVGYYDWDKCKLRSKIDVGYIENNVLEFTDNKTGKYNERDKDKYELQLDLYCAAGIAQYPTLKGVRPRLLYTDLGMQYPAQPVLVTAVQARRKQKEWNKRFAPMLAERRWAPRPGFYCQWCPFSKNFVDKVSGKKMPGPCKY
jgi:hypothetical protein